MPKVITLEKAADGSYKVPDNPIVEEIIQEKTVAGYEETQHYPKKQIRKRQKDKKIHEFIVNNGQNTADFLDGVQKTVKTFMMIKKLIK